MLNRVLRANSLSCAIFGVIFFAFTGSVAKILGNPPTLLLYIIAIVLLGNAALLFWATKSSVPNKLLILFFIVGDALWVFTSLALILAGLWITTAIGIALTIAVALFVGACGALQWKYLPA